MLPVYVMTSDKYLHALKGFAIQFNRYWSELQPVTVVGFSPPAFDLPKNFTFLSLGDYADYPKERWSNAFIKFMSIIPDELFVLMLEDYWLVRTVDHQAVESLGQYMSIHKNCIRMDLTTDRLYAGGMKDYGVWGRLDIIQSNPDHPYHLSLQAAIWRKSLLKKVIIPNETPWEVELVGNGRLSALRDEMIVLGTRQCPVRYGITLRGGNPKQYHLESLLSEDVVDLAKRGCLEIPQ